MTSISKVSARIYPTNEIEFPAAAPAGKLIRSGIFTLFDCINKGASYILFFYIYKKRDELSDDPIKLDGTAINLDLRLLKVNDPATVVNGSTPLFQRVDKVQILRRDVPSAYNSPSTITSVKCRHRGPIIQVMCYITLKKIHYDSFTLSVRDKKSDKVRANKITTVFTVDVKKKGLTNDNSHFCRALKKDFDLG